MLLTTPSSVPITIAVSGLPAPLRAVPRRHYMRMSLRPELRMSKPLCPSLHGCESSRQRWDLRVSLAETSRLGFLPTDSRAPERSARSGERVSKFAPGFDAHRERVQLGLPDTVHRKLG